MRSDVLARNHVHVVGRGERPLVFGHGFGTDQSVWRHQVEALAAEFRIVLFDLVGCGQSDLAQYSPRRYRTLHSYADDLLEILDALGLSGVDYVGHSMSATAGLLAAAQSPQSFARLVLICMSPYYLNAPGYHGGFEPKDLETLYAAMAHNFQSWAAGFVPTVLVDPDRPDVSHEVVATLTAMRPDIALNIARTAFSADHRAMLGEVPHPVLVIQPQGDQVVPMEVGEYLRTHLPQATVAVIPVRGHLPHVTHPELVTPLIRNFLLQDRGNGNLG